MINKKYLKILFLVFICLLTFSLFISFRRKGLLSSGVSFAPGIDQFHKTGLAYVPSIDKYLKRDFFKNNKISNGDFSQGLAFWATEETIINNINIFSITNQTFQSPPYALKMVVKQPPCKLYYSKNSHFSIVKNPWDYRESGLWFGVRPEQFIKISFYYKGAAPTVYINYLKQNTDVNVLKTKMITAATKKWKKFILHSYLPAGTRAISLEITINAPVKEDVFFLDDFRVEFLNNA